MKNLFILLSFFFLISTSVKAQELDKTKEHKIVFQLQSSDTTVHKALMKQLNNILTNFPNTKIEVVCHGPGLNMLVTEKTIVADKIEKLAAKGVLFVACEFSMSERKVTKEMMLVQAGTVPYGIMEIVAKQEEGWSYIKAGF